MDFIAIVYFLFKAKVTIALSFLSCSAVVFSGEFNLSRLYHLKSFFSWVYHCRSLRLSRINRIAPNNGDMAITVTDQLITVIVYSLSSHATTTIIMIILIANSFESIITRNLCRIKLLGNPPPPPSQHTFRYDTISSVQWSAVLVVALFSPCIIA